MEKSKKKQAEKVYGLLDLLQEETIDARHMKLVIKHPDAQFETFQKALLRFKDKNPTNLLMLYVKHARSVCLETLKFLVLELH